MDPNGLSLFCPPTHAVIASRRRSNLIHVYEIAILLRLKGLYEAFHLRLEGLCEAMADLALLRSSR
jgi:hypothetical protein